MEKSKSGRDGEFKYLLIILFMAIFISHLFPETIDDVCDLETVINMIWYDTLAEPNMFY